MQGVMLTMTYKSVRFENIGPIKSGEIRNHPINVFVGPTGAGKSIAARIIHGVCRFDSSKAPYQLDLYTDQHEGVRRMAFYTGHSIMKSAAIPLLDVPTHKMPSSSLEVVANGHWPKKIDFKDIRKQVIANDMPEALEPTLNGKNPSIYVPAGRTGIIQSFISTIRVRNAILKYALSQDKDRSTPNGKHKTAAGKKFAVPPRISGGPALPEYMELFYDLLFQSVAGSPTKDGPCMISNIFSGSVGSAKTAGMPITTYRNQGGFAVEITSAAAGILSSFPIVECASKVQRGGLLIVEEPEAHLEPMKQLLLITELSKISRERHFNLTLITHSDHMLGILLSLVAGGSMPSDDLGLYYFKQANGSYTNIEPVTIEKDGTAEQEMFDDAIESLGSRFI